MGEALSAIGKMIVGIIAGVIIGGSAYNSFVFFKLDRFLGFQYAAEITSLFVGFFTFVLVYVLMLKLKQKL